MRLNEYLRMLRERKWLIVWPALVVAVGAVAIGLMQPKEYRAESVLLWTRRNPGTALIGVPQPELSNFPDLELATQVGLIQQQRVFATAARTLGHGVSAAELAKTVTVSADGRTCLITVAAIGPSAKRASAIAGAVASAYAGWSRDESRRSIDAAAEEVRTSLAATRKRLVTLEAGVDPARPDRGSAELQATRELYSSLLGQLQKLESAKQLEMGSVSIVSAGTADPDPVSPRPVRDGALGLALGTCLGLGMAFLTSTLDSTLKTDEEVSSAYGAPIVGHITDDRFEADETPRVSILSHPSSSTAESYRGLRNNLQFLNFEHSIRTLMVTSAEPGEGKSSVAANLAVALAQAGQRVVLVAADFRRPGADHLLGVTHRPGLSEVLSGVDAAPVAIQKSDPGLFVLSAGSTPPNPSELLGSSAMKELLDSLEQRADFIIIDTPPLLPVADAAALVRFTDAALVVTREGTTTRETARRAREALEAVGSHITGVVITGCTETEVVRGSYHTYAIEHAR